MTFIHYVSEWVDWWTALKLKIKKSRYIHDTVNNRTITQIPKEETEFIVVTVVVILVRHNPTAFKRFVKWLVEDLKHIHKHAQQFLNYSLTKTESQIQSLNTQKRKRIKRRRWITASSASSEARRSCSDELQQIAKSTAKIPRGIRFRSPMLHCLSLSQGETLTLK